MTSRDTRRLLFFILGAAAVLRFWGLTFGLPDIYHTDEWFEVKRALKLGAGVVDLERVGKGFYYYVLFVLFGAYYALQKLLGNVAGSADFMVSIFRDPSGIWTLGRSTTAIIGTANVWVIYRAGLAMGGRAVGLIAAAGLAVHMLHANSSHYITVDVPLVCLLTLGLALIYRWQDEESLRPRQWVVLALVTAAATATKLPGAVLAVCVFLMHARMFRRAGGAWRDYLRGLWVYAAVGALVYVLFEPGIVFKIGDILRYLLSFVVSPETTDATTISYPVEPGRYDAMAGFYATTLFPAAYTILPLLFLAGAFFAVRRNGALRQPGLVFALIYAAFLLSSKSAHLIYARYVLPLVPVVLLYAAFALVEAHRRLAPRHALGRWVAPALGLVVAVPMLVDTVRLNRDFGLPDTRTAAREYIEATIPAGSSIYLAGGVVQASAMTAQLKMMPEEIDARVLRRIDETGDVMNTDKSTYYEMYKRALAEYEPTYDLILLSDATGLAAALASDRGDWALLIDVNRALFEHELNRATFSGQWELWQRVDAGEFEVVRAFSSGDDERGPSLTLYGRVGRKKTPTDLRTP